MPGRIACINSGSSSARVELERCDARIPVKRAGSLIVFLSVPEGAAVFGVHRHAAVVSPPFEALHLRARAIHENEWRVHLAERVCPTPADDCNTRINGIAGHTEAQPWAIEMTNALLPTIN